MTILALIPARGGSKRLPRKNLRPLGGKPLIQWSLDLAGRTTGIDQVLVSTDDAAIADEARRAGALVPWLRPAALATDEASSADVCLHALDWYEREHGVVEGLLLLQPTSPFRSRETVARGIELFRAHCGRSVIGVSPATAHPMWCFALEGDTMRPFIDRSGLELRSQDMPPAVVVNGSFYLVTPACLRQTRSFYGNDPVPLLTEDPREALDIDTEFDWQVAEAVLRTRSACH